MAKNTQKYGDKTVYDECTTRLGVNTRAGSKHGMIGNARQREEKLPSDWKSLSKRTHDSIASISGGEKRQHKIEREREKNTIVKKRKY